MMSGIMTLDAARYTLLVHNVYGRFYWDREDKMIVMQTADDRVCGAGAFIVRQNQRTGEWSAERRPAPRIDLELLKAERES